jgi:hypothetical protein
MNASDRTSLVCAKVASTMLLINLSVFAQNTNTFDIFVKVKGDVSPSVAERLRTKYNATLLQTGSSGRQRWSINSPDPQRVLNQMKDDDSFAYTQLPSDPIGILVNRPHLGDLYGLPSTYLGAVQSRDYAEKHANIGTIPNTEKLLDALSDREFSLRMSFAIGDTNYTLANIQVVTNKDKTITFSGDIQDGEGKCVFILDNGTISGLVRLPTRDYSIIPLNGTLHGIVADDPTLYPDHRDHPRTNDGISGGGTDQNPKNNADDSSTKNVPDPQSGNSRLTPANDLDPSKKDAANSSASGTPMVNTNQLDTATDQSKTNNFDSVPIPPFEKGEGGTNIVFTILFAYTQKVASVCQNPRSWARLAVTIMNQAFADSKVLAVAEIADVIQIGVKENNDIALDLGRFARDPDVAVKRKQFGADICVLLEVNPDEVGYSQVIGAAYSNAFCAVDWQLAVDNVSLAHEVGHLFGLRHNLEDDTGNDPFAFGHGFHTLTWRSIMCYPWPMNKEGYSAVVPRKALWSNPRITLSGIKAGKEGCSDEARALNRRIDLVSKFHLGL